MSALSLPALHSFGSVVLRAAKAVAGLRTAWLRRRLVGQLGLLDDHMLRDIGISRYDLVSVMSEPLYRDPTERLAARAADTRRARRQSAEQMHRLGWDRR